MHDPRLPNLDGAYVYADYCLGELIVLRTKNGGLASKRSLRIYRPGLTSFGTDARNRVYFTTAQDVFRIDPAGTNATKHGAPASALGRELFLASGCGTCHTLAATKAGGTYGPNLDDAKPSRQIVVDRIGGGERGHAVVQRPAHRQADPGDSAFVAKG